MSVNRYSVRKLSLCFPVIEIATPPPPNPIPFNPRESEKEKTDIVNYHITIAYIWLTQTFHCRAWFSFFSLFSLSFAFYFTFSLVARTCIWRANLLEIALSIEGYNFQESSIPLFHLPFGQKSKNLFNWHRHFINPIAIEALDQQSIHPSGHNFFILRLPSWQAASLIKRKTITIIPS